MHFDTRISIFIVQHENLLDSKSAIKTFFPNDKIDLVVEINLICLRGSEQRDVYLIRFVPAVQHGAVPRPFQGDSGVLDATFGDFSGRVEVTDSIDEWGRVVPKDRALEAPATGISAHEAAHPKEAAEQRSQWKFKRVH